MRIELGACLKLCLLLQCSCRYTLIKKTATAFARRSCGEKLQEGEARENKVVSGKENKMPQNVTLRTF